MSTSEVLLYCEQWNFIKNRPIDECSPEYACQLDRAGDMYSVAIYGSVSSSLPDAVLEVVWNNSHAGVWFLDEFGRQALNYVFKREAEDRLFLRNMTEYTYADADAETLSGATRIRDLQFTREGIVRDVITDAQEHIREIVDRSDVDVSKNWEPVPKFGDWRSLARWNRDS